MTTCFPPGRRTMTSGRIRRSPSPSVTVCCSTKSQCWTMPANSTTRLSWSSPQRPRTPGRLSASTSFPVWLRRSWPAVSSDAIRWSSCALDSMRRRSLSLSSRSTSPSVLAIGSSRCSIAVFRCSISAAAVARTSPSFVSASVRNASLLLLSASSLIARNLSRTASRNEASFAGRAIKRPMKMPMPKRRTPPMSVAISSVGSMDISIAYGGRWSPPLSRHHKGEPRFGKLKLGCVNAVRLQARAELLQHVTRGDLCMTPLVDEPPDANAQLLTRLGACGFQPGKPWTIDRFERQPGLKAGLRYGVKRRGPLETALSSCVGAITLEAHRPALGPNRPPHAAGPTERDWAFALQLAARQRNPLTANHFARRGRLESLHGGSLRPDRDRSGHAPILPLPPLLPEKVRRHSPSHDDDEPADVARIDCPREGGREVTAQRGADRHGEPIAPGDRAAHDERRQRQSVDRHAEKRLQPVHLVDVGHPGQRHRGEHHDPHATAEVASVLRNQKLCDDDSREGGSPRRAVFEWMRWFAAGLRRGPELLAERKCCGGDEHQPRQQA